MEQVTFVILHYLTLNITVQCVESICSNISYENFKVVIVDNASPNQTGLQLKELYKSNNKIKVILSEENIGFSAGNNLGYRYAKEYYQAEFIVMMNNDTIILQKNFVEEIIKIFRNSKYYVLGPDIVNLEGIHQSPQRNHIITKQEATLWYIKRYIFSKYLHLHKALKLSNDFFIMRIYKKHNCDRIYNLQYDLKKEEVELQGACLVFSPLFILEKDIAFEELTFMYGEEAILAWCCKKNNWKILYDPNLKIKHMEKYTTKILNNDLISNEIFWSDSHVKAIKSLLKYIKKI